MSFGERLSTRLFAAHLRACSVPARQHDSFAPGFNLATSDDFGAADVAYDAALPAVRAALAPPPGQPCAIPVVTGFLGRGLVTGAAPACACLCFYIWCRQELLMSGWWSVDVARPKHQAQCVYLCLESASRVCTRGFPERHLAPLCTVA